MDSDDSAPEDVPIGYEPVDSMFNKRLTAKKIKQDKKLHSVKKPKASKQLKPLPLEVIDQLSEEIPDTVLPVLTKMKKAKKGKNKTDDKVTNNSESAGLKKLPDFIPLDNVHAKCSTKFKVGILDSIMKNPVSKNYKEHVLFTSKHARDKRKTNVKNEFVKKALIKQIISRR
ncbi:hypothetical protein M8J76_001796 [Diaphorina citri]|nr:hypothetical protein M8J75_009684 [Diaphorina citri]KAI5740218.1 hypothetical protein M8J76_001796 [Diaphorina citri]KAI5746802.1 hypothetical protein M8J77_007593 [Diaphorina citri]